MGYNTENQASLLSPILGKGKRKSCEIKKKKSKNTRTLSTIRVSRANGVRGRGNVFTRTWKLARISESTAVIPR